LKIRLHLFREAPTAQTPTTPFMVIYMPVYRLGQALPPIRSWNSSVLASAQTRQRSRLPKAAAGGRRGFGARDNTEGAAVGQTIPPAECLAGRSVVYARGFEPKEARHASFSHKGAMAGRLVLLHLHRRTCLCPTGARGEGEDQPFRGSNRHPFASFVCLLLQTTRAWHAFLQPMLVCQPRYGAPWNVILERVKGPRAKVHIVTPAGSYCSSRGHVPDPPTGGATKTASPVRTVKSRRWWVEGAAALGGSSPSVWSGQGSAVRAQASR